MQVTENELSDSQKACLRLVAQGMSSKEIAIELSLSPSTVDTYIKHAMSRLGASNRREAARKYMENGLPQNFGSQPERLAEALLAAENGAQPVQVDPVSREGQSLGWRAILPPPVGGKLNDRSASQRFWDACKVVFWGVIVFLALVLIMSQALKALS